MIEHAYKAHQGVLEHVVRSIFPLEQITVNVVKEATIKNPTTGQLLELDCWIPALQLGFEFQDEYHYATTWFSNATLTTIQERDRSKHITAHREGTTLITVPCWWDCSKESLVSTVLFHRPDLEAEGIEGYCELTNAPIPMNAPPVYFQTDYVQDVGELMLASFPDLGEFQRSISSSNYWWMGEKYDGVRFCWNSLRRNLYTRSGTPFTLPPSFMTHLNVDVHRNVDVDVDIDVDVDVDVDILPAGSTLIDGLFIDGEVWSGRGAFSSSQRLIYTKHLDWAPLRLIAFDVPPPRLLDTQSIIPATAAVPAIPTTSPTTSPTTTPTTTPTPTEHATIPNPLSPPTSTIATPAMPFEERYRILLENVAPNHPFIILGSRLRIESPRFLAQYMRAVMDDGGEGVILRKPGSVYVSGRSASLVKLKASRSDQEAIVLKIEGNYVQLKLPDSRIIAVHSSNVQLSTSTSTSLQRGDIVSFSYEKLSKTALPVDPKIFKIRKDISWNDVLQSFKVQEPNRFSSQLTKIPTELEWQAKKLRATLEKIARARNLDPLNPRTWYHTSPKDIVAWAQPGTTIFKVLQGGYIRTISKLFPEIGIVESEFAPVLRDWTDVLRRRQQMERYAASHHFDPLVPANWINREINDPKMTALQGHYASLTECLLHLFPEIGLAEHMFFPSSHWKDAMNRRRFFEMFARTQGFDPLVASNWYQVEHDAISSQKGANDVLQYYRKSHRVALLKLFPEIGLEGDKIQSKDYGAEARKRVLVDFAKLHGFDPLVPQNWATITSQSLFAYPGPKRVVQRYGSVKNALLSVFKFDDVPTVYQPKYHWGNKETRRKFFENFAVKNGFDPLIAANWYSVTRAAIIKDPDSGGVLNYYAGSVSAALTQLFPEVDIDPTEFVNFPKNIWDSTDNVRRWFTNFAKRKGFDPLAAESWYQLTANDIFSKKGGWAILSKYNNSIPLALVSSFPDIGINKSRFNRPNSRMKDQKNGRQFFEDFARQHGFDALIPENWYKAPIDLVEKLRGTVLANRTASISRALQYYFPELTWEGHRFPKVERA